MCVCVKMRVGPGPLAVLALVFWTQCVLLDGVEAKKERKRPKEAPPQHTETSNTTLSNSEEVGGIIKVGPQNVWYFLLLLIINNVFYYTSSINSSIILVVLSLSSLVIIHLNIDIFVLLFVLLLSLLFILFIL